MKTMAGRLLCCVGMFCLFFSGCGSQKQSGIREITVTGVTEVMVPPDFVTVNTSVVTLNMDLARAQAENDEKVKTVLSFLEKLGLAAEDIRTSYVSLGPRERREENKPPVFEGYEASKSISMNLRDMTKYDELVSGMLGLGVNRIGGISFRSSKEIEKRREARVLAIKAAREKAEYLAGELGQKVGKPLWIAEYRKEVPSWQPIPSNSEFFMGRSERELHPDTEQGTIAPGTITIRTQVEVSFELVG